MNKRKHNDGQWGNPAKRMKQFKPQKHLRKIYNGAKQNTFNVVDEMFTSSSFQTLIKIRKKKDISFQLDSSYMSQSESGLIMSVIINGEIYKGKGKTAYLAKHAACDNALRIIQSKASLEKLQELGMQQTFADHIGHLILQKFNEYTEKDFLSMGDRGVLAGIVMTLNSDISTAKVIACATGTKSMNGQNVSCNGTFLNDTHAEVIARRCLVDYFYLQLELLITNRQSIFYETKSDANKKMYKLRDGINIHLFINTAPCGAARIFSPRESIENLTAVPLTDRTNKELLRTKFDAGTIPLVHSDRAQTWEDILKGQQLQTMSCSDKIAKWNLLGLQGSLLSSIIEPIYLTSITLGSLLNVELMNRAICERFEPGLNLGKLPAKYRLNKPNLGQMTIMQPRVTGVTPRFSFNWTVGCTEMEVINSQTGKTVDGKVSRLAKQQFFKRFTQVAQKLSLPHYKAGMFYGETKQLVENYQQAKAVLYDAFAKQNLGVWLKKPKEIDEFLVIPKKSVIFSVAKIVDSTKAAPSHTIISAKKENKGIVDLTDAFADDMNTNEPDRISCVTGGRCDQKVVKNVLLSETGQRPEDILQNVTIGVIQKIETSVEKTSKSN